MTDPGGWTGEEAVGRRELQVARLLALQASNDIPGVRTLRARWLCSLLRAPGLKVGSGVRLDCSHPQLLGRLRLGRDVELGAGTVLDVSGGLVIADETTLSEGVMILTHEHAISDRSRHWRMQSIDARPVVIGRGVWLGARAIVLGSARTVGEGAVVGAGSIVTREIPPFAVAVGNPARVVGWRGRDARVAPSNAN
ncbi:MAG: hypothetical protein ABR520_10270 [Mycobacteriales bacterium]|nr:acyltransferase [Frankia sp.]MCA1833597.1 acyltransferase [Actinomycetota bacterium]